MDQTHIIGSTERPGINANILFGGRSPEVIAVPAREFVPVEYVDDPEETLIHDFDGGLQDFEDVVAMDSDFISLDEELSGLSSEKIDEQRRSLARKIGVTAIIGLAAVSWGFEIGPWNEAFRIDRGVEALHETFDPNTVAWTVGKITGAVEVLSATLIALGLNTGNGLVEWFKNRKKGREMIDEAEQDVANDKTKSYGPVEVLKDVGIAMGGGAGVVTVRHHMKYQEAGKSRLGKDILVGAAATIPIVAFASFVGYTAAKSIVTGGESDWFGSEFVVDYGTDKKFWLGLLAVGYGMGYAKKGINALRNRKETNKPDTENVSEEERISLFDRTAVSEGGL